MLKKTEINKQIWEGYGIQKPLIWSTRALNMTRIKGNEGYLLVQYYQKLKLPSTGICQLGSDKWLKNASLQSLKSVFVKYLEFLPTIDKTIRVKHWKSHKR
jgi:hypothetical protein